MNPKGKEKLMAFLLRARVGRELGWVTGGCCALGASLRMTPKVKAH